MRKEEEEKVLIITNKGRIIILQKLIPIRLITIFHVKNILLQYYSHHKIRLLAYTISVKVTRTVLFALHRNTTESQFMSALFTLSKTAKYTTVQSRTCFPHTLHRAKRSQFPRAATDR